MEYYAGIDVSLKESSVCIVDAKGKIVREVKVASEPEALVRYFDELELPVCRIGLEAGPLYLKTIVDRSPWVAALEERPPDAFGGAEYLMPADAPIAGGADATGLGLAHDLLGLAISLSTHDHWDQIYVEVVRTTLDDNAEPLNETVPAPNASRGKHVDEHAAFLARAGLATVHDGAELWARRADILPNLHFVPSARSSIISLAHGDPNFENALRRLTEIDDAIAAWARSETPHPLFPFSVVPESRSRIREGLVDIKDATGVTRSFSDHARYGPDENRIHFIIETAPTYGDIWSWYNDGINLAVELAQSAAPLADTWQRLRTALIALPSDQRNSTILGGFLHKLIRTDAALGSAILEELLLDPDMTSHFVYLQAQAEMNDEAIARLRRAISLGNIKAHNFYSLASGVIGPAPQGALAAMLDDLCGLEGGTATALEIFHMATSWVRTGRCRRSRWETFSRRWRQQLDGVWPLSTAALI